MKQISNDNNGSKTLQSRKETFSAKLFMGSIVAVIVAIDIAAAVCSM